MWWLWLLGPSVALVTLAALSELFGRNRTR